MKIQLSDHFSYKRLLRFVAPSILMLLCTSVYSIVDGFFVSNYVGKTPFAALNLVMPVLMGVGTLGFMAGTGGSAVVSMTLGEGKKELANEFFSLIVYVTLAVSIVVGFICFVLAPQIALALGANGELEADCVRYSRILFLSSPAFVMQYLFQSFFIAAEKPTLSLKVNIKGGKTMIKVFFSASRKVLSCQRFTKYVRRLECTALSRILASVRLLKMQINMGMMTKPTKKTRLGSMNR